MNTHEAVKSFIEAQRSYNGKIGEKGSTADQNFKRLNEAVNIFEQNGITVPTEADFDNILRPAIAAKGKKAGEQAKEKTIQRTLNLARKFYHWIQSKGDFQMNDNDNIITEEQTAFSPEFAETMMLKKAIYELEAEKAKGSNQLENNEAMPEQETSKRGRPVKTGREAKFTLYMTEERMANLKAITDGLNVTMTDVLNKLIDEYCAKQSKFLELLKKQEQERKAFQEALND